MRQVQLKVVGGRQDGKLLPLPTGRFLVGREEDCQLRPKSELVSRHHCVFNVDDFAVRLRDLGSTNGTHVNGERIQGQVLLEQDDEVRIGKLEFRVVFREVADAPAPAEEQEAAILEETASMDTGETLVDMPIPEEIARAAAEEFADGPTIIEQPAPQQPQPQPQMPQPVAMQPYPMPGYPQYPYPQYPQYGAPQMPYPGQYPYPPPGQYPQQAPPMAPPESATETNAGGNTEVVAAPPVKLPDPATTGVKAPAPAEPAPQPAEGADDPNRAEGIIRDYMKKGGE